MRTIATAAAFVMIGVALTVATGAGPETKPAPAKRLDIGSPEREVAKMKGKVVSRDNVSQELGTNRRHVYNVYRMPEPDGLLVYAEQGKISGFGLVPILGMTEADFIYYNRNLQGPTYNLKYESTHQRIYRLEGRGLSVSIDVEAGTVDQIIHD